LPIWKSREREREKRRATRQWVGEVRGVDVGLCSKRQRREEARHNERRADATHLRLLKILHVGKEDLSPASFRAAAVWVNEKRFGQGCEDTRVKRDEFEDGGEKCVCSRRRRGSGVDNRCADLDGLLRLLIEQHWMRVQVQLAQASSSRFECNLASLPLTLSQTTFNSQIPPGGVLVDVEALYHKIFLADQTKPRPWPFCSRENASFHAPTLPRHVCAPIILIAG
jgi:hypothetical protein